MIKKTFLLLLFSFSLQAQKSIKYYFSKSNVSVYSGAIISSGKTTPFLIRSNNYGTVPIESQIIYSGVSSYRQYDSLYTINKKLKKVGVGYGLNLHINVGGKNQFLLPEAYIKARYGAFEIYGGRRREIQGLVDTTGTMGSYIWSGNALPIPKVEISIPNYTPIIGKGLISIKGNFAHGWFGNADSVKNYWLHQKSLYVRLGRPNWKLKFYGGFNHQVQWGGRPTKPFFDIVSNQIISSFGNNISTFIQVASGVSLSRGNKIWSSQLGVASNEAGNRSGNHLGTVDIGFEIYLSNLKIFLYRQSIYEDGSLYYLNNISDGLNGISFKFTNSWIIKKISFEYLNTISQGGNIFSNNNPELRGQDNYFNNGIYKDAWTYKSMTIGNPMLLTYKTAEKVFEKFPYYGENYIANNRIKAFNLKATYNIGQIYYATTIINSKNLGNFSTILNNLKQTSIQQSLDFKIRNNYINSVFAFDIGSLYVNNLGLNLKITRIL